MTQFIRLSHLRLAWENCIEYPINAKDRCRNGIQPAAFKQFKQNPEHSIRETTRLINEQKATIIIERLSSHTNNRIYDIDIFAAGQSKLYFSLDGNRLKSIFMALWSPTPVGDSNPDWAIAFEQGSVKHVYFVAETKGSVSTMELCLIEDTNIRCIPKFFEKINYTTRTDQVKYDVMNSFGRLMEIVGGRPKTDMKECNWTVIGKTIKSMPKKTVSQQNETAS